MILKFDQFLNEVIDVNSLNTDDEDLIDFLISAGYEKVIKKDGVKDILIGVKLKQDTKFYHGSNRKYTELKPKYPTTISGENSTGKKPVLNLGDYEQAEGWGKYIYEIILPKDTEIFQGMDGAGHIVIFTKVKIFKLYNNENYEE